MPELNVNGTRLYYEDSGEKNLPALVCLHSLLFDLRMFDDLADLLRGRFRIIRYDHRGQGRSAPSDLKSVDMDTCAEDLRELITKLHPDPVHIVAQSMGGDIALRLAIRRPSLVQSLILMGASAGAEAPKNMGKFKMMSSILRFLGPKPLLGPTMKIMFGKSFRGDPRRREKLRLWRRRIGAVPRGTGRAVNGVIHRGDLTPDLHRIQCPVLILSGEEDEARPPAWSEAMAEKIKGAKVISMPGIGHSPSIEAPERVSDYINDFLGDRGPAS